MSKKYYFPNDEHIDRVFGAEMPCCLDAAEVDRLAIEWSNDGGMPENVLEQFHEATADEIAEYGVYDS